MKAGHYDTYIIWLKKYFSNNVKMEIKESEKNILYPTLPTAPVLDEGQGYRLQKISEIQQTLEGERENRQNVSKKLSQSREGY